MKVKWKKEERALCHFIPSLCCCSTVLLISPSRIFPVQSNLSPLFIPQSYLLSSSFLNTHGPPEAYFLWITKAFSSHRTFHICASSSCPYSLQLTDIFIHEAGVWCSPFAIRCFQSVLLYCWMWSLVVPVCCIQSPWLK